MSKNHNIVIMTVTPFFNPNQGAWDYKSTRTHREGALAQGKNEERAPNTQGERTCTCKERTPTHISVGENQG